MMPICGAEWIKIVGHPVANPLHRDPRLIHAENTAIVMDVAVLYKQTTRFKRGTIPTGDGETATSCPVNLAAHGTMPLTRQLRPLSSHIPNNAVIEQIAGTSLDKHRGSTRRFEGEATHHYMRGILHHNEVIEN